jgi:hypothetical protein
VALPRGRRAIALPQTSVMVSRWRSRAIDPQQRGQQSSSPSSRPCASAR